MAPTTPTASHLSPSHTEPEKSLGERGTAARRTVLHAPVPRYRRSMCRSIRTLHNFEPPATDDEVSAAALQFVRKISGSRTPSKANEDAFARALDEITVATRDLVDSLVTTAAPKNREEEAAKAKARSAARYA